MADAPNVSIQGTPAPATGADPTQPVAAQPQQQAPVAAAPVSAQDQPNIPNEINVYDVSGNKPIPGTLPDSQVTEAVASGSFSFPKGAPVPVIAPDGTIGTLEDPSQAPEAFANGYKYATSADLDNEKYNTFGNTATAFAEGVGQGLAGPVATAAELALGRNPEEMRKTAEHHAVAHGLGEATGFLAPAVATLGASGAASLGVQGAADVAEAINAGSKLTQAGLVGQVGEAAAKAMGLEGGSFGAKLAQGVAKTATEMSLFAAGDEVTKALQQDPNQTAQTALADIGTSALVGGALGAVGTGVGALWKASGASQKLGEALGMIKNDANGLVQADGPSVHPMVAKAISLATDVPEADIQAYAASRAAINSIPDDSEIYQHALNHVEAINQRASDAAVNAKDAAEVYKQLEQQVQTEYQNQGMEVKKAAKMAADTLAKAQEAKQSEILQTALNQGAPVTDAMKLLKQQIIDGSGKARDILDTSNKAIDLHDFYGKGLEIMGKLREQNTLESHAMADHIEKYLNLVSAPATEGGKRQFAVPAAKAKSMIQGLDAASSYPAGTADIPKGLSPYYNQLRNTLDETLKNTVPGYREAMLPVAERMKLQAALDPFGDEERVVSRLRSLKDPVRYKNEMPALKDLEAKTGLSFTDKLEDYANPELNKTRLQNIPEYKAAQEAAQLKEALSDPRRQAFVDEFLSKSDEHQAMVKAAAEKAAALAEKAKISGVTPNNLQGVLAVAQRGKIAPNRILSQFPDMEGKELPELLNLSRIKNAFQKSTINGSRKVNMYAGVLGGIGGALTGHAGAGIGLGAGLGGMADKYGPTVAKKVLDAYLDHFGSVTKAVGNDNRDVVRLAIAKMLDKDAALTVAPNRIDMGSAPNPDGFKGTVDFTQAVMNGEKRIKAATKNIFKDDADVLPKSAMPTEADRNRLQKQMDEYQQKQTSPNVVDYMNKKFAAVSHYMPDHGEALTQTTANIANYLHQVKPIMPQAGLLDRPMEMPAGAKAQYDRTLNIAEQPLIILHNIKKGTLTPRDLQDFNTMFPALKNKLAQELTSSMIEHASKGNIVPYQTRLGLTLFLGQPMDSTLTQNAIISAQPMSMPQQQPQQPQKKPPTKSQSAALEKMPQMARTPQQAAAQGKQSRE